jgi:dTDP-glucose 4,6-dehydratase
VGRHWLITGGLGFIGSHFVDLLSETYPDDTVAVLDAQTYAADQSNILRWSHTPRLVLRELNIAKRSAVEDAMRFSPRPDFIVNFAAESHVDRSISSADEFIHSNVQGTNVMLDLAKKNNCRMIQISTDEVYGSTEDAGTDAFTETTPLHPNSPYSASKAAADLLVLAYHRTHKTEVVITRSTNNYGPRQHPEKLIPKAIVNALRNMPIPVYAQGLNRRSWIHVLDNCRGILAAAEKGISGKIYNIGLKETHANIEVVKAILRFLGRPESLITFVADRKGHDLVYAVDSSLAQKELSWQPKKDFETGLEETVKWYVDNREWWEKKL